MSVNKVYFRHCVLYELQQGRKATEGCLNLVKVRFPTEHAGNGLKSLKLAILSLGTSPLGQNSQLVKKFG